MENAGLLEIFILNMAEVRMQLQLTAMLIASARDAPRALHRWRRLIKSLIFHYNHLDKGNNTETDVRDGGDTNYRPILEIHHLAAANARRADLIRTRKSTYVVNNLCMAGPTPAVNNQLRVYLAVTQTRLLTGQTATVSVHLTSLSTEEYGRFSSCSTTGTIGYPVSYRSNGSLSRDGKFSRLRMCKRGHTLEFSITMQTSL